MPRKKTHEEFLEEVKALVGEEYEVIGKYIKSSEKIEMKHKVCGHEYKVRPNDFLTGSKCTKCSGLMKKTTEIFKREVFALTGDEYEAIGEYVNSQNKTEMEHKVCGYRYDVTPSSFLNGSRCPKCAGVMKKTTKQFKQEVYDLVGDEYDVIGEYVNNNTKIEMKHDICSYKFDVRPVDFLRGGRCPKCFWNHKKTTEIFKKEVYNLIKKEYEVIGEYVNDSTKVVIRHNECGYRYDVRPSSFLRGSRCPKCSGLRKKNTDVFKEEVFKLEGDKYEVLGEYINNKTKIKMTHNICSFEYDIVPSNFLTGSRCPKCSGRIQKNTEVFKQEVYDLVGDEYKVLGEYVNNNTKIRLSHDTCGYEYNITPGNFLRGCRCSKCSSSKGEKGIRFYLDAQKVKFSLQYRFSDCRNKQPLPFDFAIFNPNKTLNCLIEYDGEQHYQSVKHWGGEETFKKRQHNDQIKNQYCKDNNIKLIRIPYWDFDNIEDILNKELKEVINQSKSESNV